MTRKLAIFVSIVLCLALMPGPAFAGGPERFSPGAAGAGDPYFPLDGNGGYDVKHYDLKVRYNPSTDRLSGTAAITARATKNLSKFNLDFEGLRVDWITVNGDAATWRRHNGELTITPRHGLPRGDEFVTVVRYRGVPEPIVDAFGESGFLHTDDGALVIGEPHVADTWFPVNDHPTDKASYALHITVPRGLKAISNGVLQEREHRGAWTMWTWQAREPMASYLVGMGIGKFETRSYRADGIRYWDAVDPDLLLSPFAPRTGDQFAVSQQADAAYKRLARTISVPAGGAELSFWVHRDTEPGWDYLFVEAHTPGMDDWTTLPDANAHTSQETGFVCPFWLALHPFLTHYQTEVPGPEPACEPTGSSGEWWAASGFSDGYEQWTVDLSGWANGEVEVSLTYATDESVQLAGLFVDDIEVSTGDGSTSFEADGDVMDGWTTPGAPDGSPGNLNDWIAGTVDAAPPAPGEVAFGSLDRQPEILAFESGLYGPYPFSAAGGIVDDYPIGFALENQTRPIYSQFFFGDPISGDFVVVHELAHQWVGDSLAVQRWRHIWLNEGFATYTEWLWSESQGLGTAQEVFDFWYGIVFSEDNEFWDLLIGNPGPDHLFDFQVYVRGAMTLHQLRLAVGDGAFFEILERWGQSQAGGNVTTNEFIRLAERVSGQELDELFNTWLFTPERPVVDGAAPLRVSADLRDAPSAVRSMIARFKDRPGSPGR